MFGVSLGWIGAINLLQNHRHRRSQAKHNHKLAALRSRAVEGSRSRQTSSLDGSFPGRSRRGIAGFIEPGSGWIYSVCVRRLLGSHGAGHSHDGSGGKTAADSGILWLPDHRLHVFFSLLLCMRKYDDVCGTPGDHCTPGEGEGCRALIGGRIGDKSRLVELWLDLGPLSPPCDLSISRKSLGCCAHYNFSS